MGKNAKWTRFLLAGVVLAVLAVGGYWLSQRGAAESCNICKRPVHAQARAVVEADGRREAVCCARCAFTFEEQRHKSVRLVEVSDYHSAKPLAPQDAYFVEGSRVLLCAMHEPLLDQTKHPYGRVFDRCEPSVYAFARREDAEAFAGENGGKVRRLAELLQEVRPQP